MARIQVAVIGAGHWGPNLIRNFYNDIRSRVCWIIDKDDKRLDEVGRYFPGVPLGDDPRLAIEDPKVDAVVISTPTSTHYGLTKWALERRKHVLVEKPLTADVAQAEELADLADDARRLLMVGHVFIYNPAVQWTKRAIQSGRLGAVHYVASVRTNLGPIRADVNAAWDLASQDLSIVNYWLDAAPLTASATGGTWINAGIEDAVFVTLRYPANVLANFHVSWLNPRKAREITLVGERQMLTYDDMNLNEPLRVYDKHVTDGRTTANYTDTFGSFRTGIRDGDITIPKVAMGEPLRAECEHFLTCICNESPPLTGAREALDVVRGLDAIRRSIQDSGREAPV